MDDGLKKEHEERRAEISGQLPVIVKLFSGGGGGKKEEEAKKTEITLESGREGSLCFSMSSESLGPWWGLMMQGSHGALR